MGRRRQSDDQEMCRKRPKAWNRTPPILLISKTADLRLCDFFTVSDQPRTAAAIDNLRLCERTGLRHPVHYCTFTPYRPAGQVCTDVHVTIICYENDRAGDHTSRKFFHDDGPFTHQLGA